MMATPMTYSPSKRPKRRNPEARALRELKRFRSRMVPNGKRYRRRPKHRRCALEAELNER